MGQIPPIRSLRAKTAGMTKEELITLLDQGNLLTRKFATQCQKRKKNCNNFNARLGGLKQHHLLLLEKKCKE